MDDQNAEIVPKTHERRHRKLYNEEYSKGSSDSASHANTEEEIEVDICGEPFSKMG